ncbi:MAG: DUF5655 domain-containing protein [Dehalococcoidia bacterium]
MQPQQIWTCEACGREFGKRQSHVCAPAVSVDAYYADRPPVEREIFEVVRAHLQELGPLIVEPVGIGILFKLKRTFAELRPRTKWVALGFGLNRQLAHQRITRTTKMGASRGWYGTNLQRPEDFDEQVRAWLTESYVEYAG